MKLRLLSRSFRFLWQRITRGWDDSEVWSLDVTIAEFALPRLRRLKEIQHGHPGNLTEQEWDRVLDEIAWFFELHIKNGEDGFALIDADQTRYEAAAGYLGKYFGHLWD